MYVYLSQAYAVASDYKPEVDFYDKNGDPVFRCDKLSPEGSTAEIYRAQGENLLHIGSITDYQCVLHVGGTIIHNNQEVIPTRCHYPGTGAFFKERYFLVRDHQLVEVSRQSLNLPQTQH